MHPVLARYLDTELTREVLRRADAGEEFGEEHRFLVEAARAHPSQRRAVVKPGAKKLDSAGQQAALFLATHAVVRALREDERFRDRLAEVGKALRELGADQEDIDGALGQLVADEAFGSDQDPGRFDADWFNEALANLPGLLALDEERVNRLLEGFTAKGDPSEARLREKVARALLESAWSSGASPINVEDVEDALDALEEELGGKAFPKAALVLSAFVEYLRDQHLMGPLRTERLAATARHAAATAKGTEA